MNKVEKALEIIHLIKPEYEDFENFPRKDEITMDMFLEVVAFMTGHVLSARLDLSPKERNQLMNRLVIEVIDKLTIQAANKK